MERVYLDEVLVYQDLIKKRKAADRIGDITVARTTFANSDEVTELIDSIKHDAGLPMHDYLEAPMDKAGLSALAQQLSGSPDKKV